MHAYLETRTYIDGFPLMAMCFDDNNYLAHWHIDVEMVYVCEGSIRISVNDESRILHQGDLALFSSTDIHHYDSTNLHSKIIVVVFHPELIGKPAGWPESNYYNPVFIERSQIDSLGSHASENLGKMFCEIVSEFEAKRPFYQEYLRGRIIEFCALVSRHFLSPDAVKSGKKIRLPDIDKVKKAIEYIHNNYMSDITLDIISGVTNLSPSYFSRLFKKYSGANFNVYLGRRRSDAAENLIRTTQRSITDIAYDCGFNSIRTFNRVFKSLKGYSPTQVRTNQGTNQGDGSSGKPA